MRFGKRTPQRRAGHGRRQNPKRQTDFHDVPRDIGRGFVRKRAGKAWAALHCDVASGCSKKGSGSEPLTLPLRKLVAAKCLTPFLSSLLSGVDPAGVFPLLCRPHACCALADRLRCPVSYCSVRHIGNLWQNRHDRVMKYKLPKLVERMDTNPKRQRGWVPNLPRWRFGLACLLLALSAWPLAGSAQQRQKRSDYATKRVAAVPENKELEKAVLSKGRGGEDRKSVV